MNRKMVCLVILIAALATYAHGQYNRDRDFRTVRDGNNVTITEFRGSGTVVRIPSQIGRRRVTGIADRAFQGRGLTSVSIPSSVTWIGHDAFRNNRLTNVAIPSGITSIGRGAFHNNQIHNVIIPDSVVTIWEHAFSNNQLTDVAIPDSVTLLKLSAFRYNRLANITISNSITEIEWETFANNQLTCVTIPNGVTRVSGLTPLIGSDGSIVDHLLGAFANNPMLTSISIPDSVSVLDETVFAGSLRHVTQISIGVNVELVGDSDFVWRGFREAYEANNRRAGIYTLVDGEWSWQSR